MSEPKFIPSAKPWDTIHQCNAYDCGALFRGSSMDTVQERALDATGHFLCLVDAWLWYVADRASCGTAGGSEAVRVNRARAACEHEWGVGSTSDGYRFWECVKCGQRAKARPGEIV